MLRITCLEKSSCPLKKFIFPARENIVKTKFLRKLKLIVPYSDDEEHSPSEFYYPGDKNDPNATFQGEDKTEQNNNKKQPRKSLFYKVRTNCDPTKPYNKSPNNLVSSVCTGKYIAFGFYRIELPLLLLGLYEKPQAIFSRVQTSHSVNKSLILNITNMYNYRTNNE